jgi:hypothetical protein
MTSTQAAEIVGALADGRHPLADAPLPLDHLCQHPDVVRALTLAAQHLRTDGTRRRGVRAPQAGKPWSDDEDRRLADAFDAKTPVKELAAAHERSVNAIEARLARLGKIPDAATRYKLA